MNKDNLTPEVKIKLELEERERDYLRAQEYIKTGEYVAEKERLRLEIEKIITTSNFGTDAHAQFILGRCYSLIKEMYRHQDFIKAYESKKKSLNLHIQRQATH